MKIIGIGNDIIQKNRIESKANIEKKFLTNRELDFLEKILDKDERLNYISGRWAAKESVIKATDKKFIFSDIEIINSPTGKPEVYISGKLRKDIFITISHEIEYATSFCIFVED